MAKKFIAHRRNKKRVLKILLWLFIIYISFSFFYKLLVTLNGKNILKDKEAAYKIMNWNLNNTHLKSLNLLDTSDIFSLALNTLLSPSEEEYDDIFVIDRDSNDENPIVYIYSTHQNETYDSSFLEAYNISYTVEMASYILRDYLRDYGVSSYVETESMSDYLKNNGLLYKNSYEASRYYITKRKEEMPSIRFLIDFHRDSASREATTAEVDGQNYAKVLFVVGLDYSGYEEKLALAENLSSKLDSRITRGIAKKTGSNVNGIYNQDLSSESILLEIGGKDNTIDEVNNTLKVVSKVLFEYINGE